MIYWLHTKILIYFYLAEWTNLLRTSAIHSNYKLKCSKDGKSGKGAKFCQRGHELEGNWQNLAPLSQLPFLRH